MTQEPTPTLTLVACPDGHGFVQVEAPHNTNCMTCGRPLVRVNPSDSGAPPAYEPPPFAPPAEPDIFVSRDLPANCPHCSGQLVITVRDDGYTVAPLNADEPTAEVHGESPQVAEVIAQIQREGMPDGPATRSDVYPGSGSSLPGGTEPSAAQAAQPPSGEGGDPHPPSSPGEELPDPEHRAERIGAIVGLYTAGDLTKHEVRLALKRVVGSFEAADAIVAEVEAAEAAEAAEE